METAIVGKWGPTNIFPTLYFILTFIIKQGLSIECYECVHNLQKFKRKRRFVFPCSEFDGSEKFKVKCPDSAFCVYQIISLKLASETINIRSMDGCTPNATDQERAAERRLADSGCTEFRQLNSPSSTSYCFCSTDYCNGSSSPTQSLFTNLYIFLLIFTLNKFIT